MRRIAWCAGCGIAPAEQPMCSNDTDRDGLPGSACLERPPSDGHDGSGTTTRIACRSHCDQASNLERVPALDLVESCSIFSERALVVPDVLELMHEDLGERGGRAVEMMTLVDMIEDPAVMMVAARGRRS